MTLEALAKQGHANVYSSLAASIGPRIREIRKEAVKESFSGFQHEEHRLETVAVIHGMEFINDSRSTNLNSTWFALETISRPVIWIAGGMDHSSDYSVLRPLAGKFVKGMVFLGPDTRRLHEAFDDLDLPTADVTTMDDAVRVAYAMGKNNDVVLLSPGCASFNLFDNYEERGRAFREAVKNL